MLARIPHKILLSAVAGVLLIGAGVGVGAYAVSGGSKTVVKTVASPTTSSSTSFTSSQNSLSAGQIYKQASPAVVEITVTQSSGGSGFFGQGGGSSQAQGSGFVYDTQGHIVTDQHVVAGASSISVRFSNGATYKATVVGTDASSDLAVIKVNAPSSLLHPLALADSDSVQVGDDVVAIGSPFGLEGTLTSGIVSALHRDITSPNNFTITDTIQTDAAINHGNSGGVLLNTDGKVVGVTAQIDSESGGNDGVGFAIPSNTVRSVVGQIIGSGSVQRAYLGVHIQTIPSDVAAQLNMARRRRDHQRRRQLPGLEGGAQGLHRNAGRRRRAVRDRRRRRHRGRRQARCERRHAPERGCRQEARLDGEAHRRPRRLDQDGHRNPRVATVVTQAPSSAKARRVAPSARRAALLP